MSNSAKRTGRPSSPETQARLDKILKFVTTNPGVSNPELSAHMGLPTLQTSVLAKRLSRDGLIRVDKIGRGLTFTAV